MTQLSEIYNARILELSAHIARAERLDDAHATATAHSKLCGSTVSVDLKLADDRVTAYGQTVKACLLGQAAASVMGRNIVGTSAGELREVGAAMRKMLKEGGPPPGERWADLAVLEPVKDYKARHASTLLVFDAVEAALAKAEARQTSSAAAPA
jgi:NifU-like protein involved in Fe-S cluster formation